MDWHDIPDSERERTAKLELKDLENILSQAIQSEWWKYFKVRLSQTLKNLDTEMKKKTAKTLDECISYSNQRSMYQSIYEIMNFDTNLLKAKDISISIDNNSTSELISPPVGR